MKQMGGLEGMVDCVMFDDLLNCTYDFLIVF